MQNTQRRNNMMTDSEISKQIASNYSYFWYLSYEEQQTLIKIRRAEYGEDSDTR